MKRSLKTFSLLMAALLLLVSGVDTTLDRMERSATQNYFSWYDGKGNVVLAYTGEAALSQKLMRPARPVGTFSPAVPVNSHYL